VGAGDDAANSAAVRRFTERAGEDRPGAEGPGLAGLVVHFGKVAKAGEHGEFSDAFDIRRGFDAGVGNFEEQDQGDAEKNAGESAQNAVGGHRLVS